MKLTITERLMLTKMLASTGASVVDALRIKLFIQDILAISKEEFVLIEGKLEGKNFVFNQDKDPMKEIQFPSEIVSILDGYYHFADENKTVTQSDLPLLKLIEAITMLK